MSEPTTWSKFGGRPSDNKQKGGFRVAPWPMMVLHWLHVACGVFWAGTVLYTRVVLFPSLKTLPADTSEAVRAELVTGRNRQLTYWMAGGTVGLGFLRGLLAGALNHPLSAYGITFLASAILGLAMLVHLIGPWGPSPLRRKLYVAAFPVIFTLMILMHFGL